MESTFGHLLTTRHKLPWLSHMRSEILAVVNILSQVAQDNVKPDYIIIINKLIQHVKSNPEDGLTFRKLYVKAIKIMVYPGGSFSSNNDGSSRVRYHIFIYDKSNKANLIDFPSENSEAMT